MIGDGSGARPWVYNAMSDGFFRRAHRFSGYILLLLYVALPWVSLGGERLVYIDWPARHFYFFGITFTAFDSIFIFLSIFISVFAIALVTALWGRLWCGYFCPQTVFLEELVRRIEYWIEGDRGARRRLDRAPWDAKKVIKKASKWTILTALAFALSMVFVSYFEDPSVLWSGKAGNVAYYIVAAFAVPLAIDFLWFREQFCNYLCPYARIQGALTDTQSLVIGYDPARGEPRLGTEGVKKKDAIESGACINCNRCVTVCPQGIDIRDGYQLECIACGHCVDACTDVMSKNGHKSLVLYTTEDELSGVKEKPFRLRLVAYGLLLVAAVAVGIMQLSGRQALDAKIIRAVGAPVTELDNGMIQNRFDAHIFNNSDEPIDVSVTVDGIEVEDLIVAGATHIEPDSDLHVSVIVVADPAAFTQRSTPFEFVFTAGEDEVRWPATYVSNAE